jgi:iron complex outermembrane receptor protein
MTRKFAALALAGASTLALASPTWAQLAPADQPASDAVEAAKESNDIIVTARRREEAVQDVPQTVNVVTAAEIQKLNLRDFTDIESVVAGLTLTRNASFSAEATVRGVQFRPEASGNNPTVEFYLNDTPIASNFLFQSLYDVGQFELLRGPQGTLRGRASPSGSITLTTRRPDLQEVGAVLNFTGTDRHAYKGDFAFNIPILQDVLGVRLAGLYNDDRGNDVHSIREGEPGGITPAPYSRTRSLRASARFEPTDWFSANVMYQTLRNRTLTYGQVESASFVTGATPVGRLIEPDDRLALGDTGGRGAQDMKVLTWNAEVHWAGQRLVYAGSWNKQNIVSVGGNDPADYFAPPRFPVTPRAFQPTPGFEQACEVTAFRSGVISTNQSYFQCTDSKGVRKSHEIRLQSDDRIGGIFDYVVGFFYDHNDNPTRLTSETPLLLGTTGAAATTIGFLSLTPITRDSNSTEKSFFGNVTAHLGGLELSGGARHINYKDFSTILLSGRAPVASEPSLSHDDNTWIYTASAKYKINPDLMVYASVGSSWRPYSFAVGDFSVTPSDREYGFTHLPPEKSTSYEIGLKSTLFGGRGRLNLTLYRQDFDNYVYRADPGVYYISYTANRSPGLPPIAGVGRFNFIAGVPARVQGVEVEASYQILPQWSINGNFSYADGKIKNATIPCTDLNGDNVPDLDPALPTPAALQAAVGPGQTISQCTGFNGRTLNGPKWSANLQSEAGFPLSPKADAFVRGLLSYTPHSHGDPNNTNDEVNGYALINLYTGVRDPDGAWELSVFAKNVLNTKRILSIGGAPISESIRTLTGGSVAFGTDYYGISTLAPREFGVTLHMAIGSR